MRAEVTAFLQWLESTWVSTTLRDSPNIFLYPTILAFHTLGLAFFVGISSVIALRVLGVARDVPLEPFKKLLPIMWIGFFFNAASGLLLLLIEPTKFLTMFDFYVKIAAIAAAVYCNRRLYTGNYQSKPLAVAILFLWAAAITAGRLTAYDDGFVQRETAIGTLIVSTALVAIGFVSVKAWKRVRQGWKRSLDTGSAGQASRV